MSVSVLSHYFCLLKFHECRGAIWDTNSLHQKTSGFLKRARQLLVCRYSSRPPNGWNNLMKIRQGNRLERNKHEGKKNKRGRDREERKNDEMKRE